MKTVTTWLLAAVLILTVCTTMGCIMPAPPHYAHAHAHPQPRCQIQYGEIMHPLVDPNGCQYLMGDSQFRTWQQPVLPVPPPSAP